MRYTVQLKDRTVGVIDDNLLAGQDIESFLNRKITVLTRRENGTPKKVSGKLVDVLGRRRY